MTTEIAYLWFNAPLGLTCVYTCRTQDCARPAVSERESWGWKFRRNGPPKTKGSVLA